MHSGAVAVPLAAVPSQLVSLPLPPPPPPEPPKASSASSSVPLAAAPRVSLVGPPHPEVPTPPLVPLPRVARQEAERPPPTEPLPAETPPKANVEGMGVASQAELVNVSEEKSAVVEQPGFAVYPPSCEKPQLQRVAPFGEVQLPCAFAAPVCVPVTESLSTLPQQLPPPYVVFGGARYEQVPLAKKTRRHLDSSGSCQRATALKRDMLAYMRAQLKLAGEYLHLGAPEVPLNAPHGRELSRSTTVTAEFALSSGDGSFSQNNIWTVAYTGTVKALHTFIESLEVDTVNAKGFVLYNRRQYGIKKCGERFLLGLGRKATPIQFDAVAGHLDNVVLLLHCGARDDSAPRLKDIVAADAMEIIQEVTAGSRGRRAALGSKAKAGHDVPVTRAPVPLRAEEVVPPVAEV
ncbi:calphotin-like protein [Trypanosoma conorhini]|uniref:Calphotin-like protein n=1 Tax=Trypanosoma conorhini TaxID=83891 RepID=A0A3R7NYD6_9TRYP|nr:calphotin-like protein [Trypanosoma conorhini]RNF25771.1 calphotin-like protein [Trypanosoma conorhini]